VLTKQAAYELVPDWEKPPRNIGHWDVADVAVDARDRVYLLTRRDNRVLVYDRDGSFITSWGDGYIGTGCHGIAVDANFNVYVVDWREHYVTKFSSDGTPIFTLGSRGVPSNTGVEPWPPKEVSYTERLRTLTSAGPFNGCTALAIGSTGDLFVTDGYGNARIHHFAPDGELIESWGSPGSGPGQFHNPHGVRIGPDKLMYVSDRENERVQLFTQEFEFVREIPVQRPGNAVLGSNGRIAVCSLDFAKGHDSFTRGKIQEDIPARVTVFDESGNELFRFGGDGGHPLPEGTLNKPNGIAIDSRGDIYVSQVPSLVASSANPIRSDSPQIVKFRCVS
jgi:sugar lactone lactonase YvrE